MNPPTLRHGVLPDCPESLAASGKHFWASLLLAVLALALWLAAIGLARVDAQRQACAAPAQAAHSAVTLWDATTHPGMLASADAGVAEPAETRLADLLTADIDGSDAERFPARSNVPLGNRAYGWLKSAAFLADNARVNELLRPPDA